MNWGQCSTSKRNTDLSLTHTRTDTYRACVCHSYLQVSTSCFWVTNLLDMVKGRHARLKLHLHVILYWWICSVLYHSLTLRRSQWWRGPTPPPFTLSPSIKSRQHCSKVSVRPVYEEPHSRINDMTHQAEVACVNSSGVWMQSWRLFCLSSIRAAQANLEICKNVQNKWAHRDKHSSRHG